MRLADSALDYNPAAVMALTQLMEGGLYLQHRQLGPDLRPPRAAPCCSTRLRYFDPVRRRAGLPQDVAALVDSWGPDSLTLTLVNISPSQARSVDRAGRRLWRAPDRLGLRRQGHDGR